MAESDLAALAARAIDVAEETAATQSSIVAQQKQILARQSRLRVLARLLAVSLAVDIALSVVLFLVVGHQVSLTHSIHASQLAACSIANRNRASQAQVLDHLITASKGPPGETAEQRKVRLERTAAARDYVDSHFRPVDCSALYRAGAG